MGVAMQIAVFIRREVKLIERLEFLSEEADSVAVQRAEPIALNYLLAGMKGYAEVWKSPTVALKVLGKL